MTLRSAIQQAIEGTEDSEGTEPESSEAAEDETPTPPDAPAEGDEEDTTDDGEAESEDLGDEATDTDTPTEYFGLDLSTFGPKQRADIIGELKQRDDTIGKLLRERTEESVSTQATENEPESAPKEVSDEEILQLLGLDPENDPLDETAAKVALPLARQQMKQGGLIRSLMEMQELADIDRTWRQGLSGMEREFGVLPEDITHERVMEFSAENGISNPMDAYWRIVGPGRASLTKTLEDRREREAKATAAKKAVATTRPASTQADDDAPLQGKTVKAATREVATKLLAELGLGT